MSFLHICCMCVGLDIVLCISVMNAIHILINCLPKIPPTPPKPDFNASREKLQCLGEGEGLLTKDEFSKMKQELEA